MENEDDYMKKFLQWYDMMKQRQPFEIDASRQDILKEIQHKDFVRIQTWKDYRHQLHDGKIMHQQFNNLLRLHHNDCEKKAMLYNKSTII